MINAETASPEDNSSIKLTMTDDNEADTHDISVDTTLAGDSNITIDSQYRKALTQKVRHM